MSSSTPVAGPRPLSVGSLASVSEVAAINAPNASPSTARPPSPDTFQKLNRRTSAASLSSQRLALPVPAVTGDDASANPIPPQPSPADGQDNQAKSGSPGQHAQSGGPAKQRTQARSRPDPTRRPTMGEQKKTSPPDGTEGGEPVGRDRAMSTSSTTSTLHIKLPTDGARSRVARTQPPGTPPGAPPSINDLAVQSGKMAQAARTSAVAQSKHLSSQPALPPGRRPTANIGSTVAYPPEATLAQAAPGRRLSVFSAIGDATDGQGLEMLPGAYRRSGEYEAAVGSLPTLDRRDLEAAMGATFAQRGTTSAAAHSLALASQVLTLVTAGALGASEGGACLESQPASSAMTHSTLARRTPWCASKLGIIQACCHGS